MWDPVNGGREGTETSVGAKLQVPSPRTPRRSYGPRSRDVMLVTLLTPGPPRYGPPVTVRRLPTGSDNGDEVGDAQGLTHLVWTPDVSGVGDTAHRPPAVPSIPVVVDLGVGTRPVSSPCRPLDGTGRVGSPSRPV